MRFKEIGILAAALGLAPSHAWACEIDPFLFQLPGETQADAQARSDGTVADHETVRLYNRELASFENATTIYLGRVVARTRGSYVPGNATDPSTTVRPIASIKGAPASDDRILAGEAAGGLCIDRGDGLGAFADNGDLVVVFEGLPKSIDRPKGIDSLPAKAIRTIPLLHELRKHGKDLEE
jgi:hypothetical protein